MNLLYSIYFSIPNFSGIGIVGKIVNRIIGEILKRIFDLFVPSYLKRTSKKMEYGLNTEPRDEIYIVSLTSFPGRIDYIWITIELMLRQTFKPDKIILWLAKTQFSDIKLPESLISLQERGLSIQFCNEDLRAHKKYFFAMQRYPNANIITIDDDLYFDKNLIKNVVNLHKAFPKCICTNRAHKFTFDKAHNIKPYRKWKHNVTEKKPSIMLVPTGGAGTLYPPKILPETAFNSDSIKQLCIFADDLWLKSMSLINQTKVVTNGRYNKDFVSIKTTQNEKLVTQNVIAGGNDVQFKNVIDYFGIELKSLNCK